MAKYVAIYLDDCEDDYLGDVFNAKTENHAIAHVRRVWGDHGGDDGESESAIVGARLYQVGKEVHVPIGDWAAKNRAASDEADQRDELQRLEKRRLELLALRNRDK